MAAQPGLDLLVPDEFDVLVTAPGEGHDEGPGLVPLAFLVQHLARVAKVHLGLLAGRRFDADGDFGAFGFLAADEAVDGGVAAGVAPFPQALVDGGDFDPSSAQGENQVTVGFHRGGVLRWGAVGPGLAQQAGQFFLGRQGLVQQALFPRPGVVAPHRLAVEAQRAGDGPFALSGLQMSQNLSNVHEVLPFGWHPALLH